MKWPLRVDLAFLQQTTLLLLLLTGIPSTITQRTHARQGVNRDAPTVRISGQGTVAGKEVFVSRTQRVVQYLGIPYAQPPIRKLRFSAPVTDPLPSWSGVRNASQFAPSCQQVSNRLKLHEKLYMQLLPQDQPEMRVSEDCLFLNIFIPDGNRPPEGWPVMVWFHGGDFNTGTPAIWDASVFVTKQKILVVTVAYRLNILGFFTSGDGEAPGNYGMFDQVAALDWIQKNIHQFDGSASNVVIAGHSSGAISVGLHMMSPHSRGKFAKAIALSGDAVGSVGSPEAEMPVIDIVADRFGCYRKPTTALLKCLRNVNETILVRESSDIETWGPIVDVQTNNDTDPFLPEHPKDTLDNGNFNSEPFLAGYTNNEQALAYIEAIGRQDTDGKLSSRKFESMISDESMNAVRVPFENSSCELRPEMVADAVLFFYKPHPPTKDQSFLRDRYLDLQTDKNYAAGLTLLAGKMSKKATAYVYRFDYRPRTQSITRDVPEWAGVPHMFELPFVWGLPYTMNSMVQWNPADKKMADNMMSMLAGFVREGNPSIGGIRWEPYTEENPGILIIGKNIDMSAPNTIDYKALAFWNEYYPKVLQQAVENCCNMTGNSARRHFVEKRLLSLVLTIALVCLRR
ncbi:fatty acyl-CoA hydrolase precursor, medium chain-like [Prorops nasuta]|uniref:fatty acyl-CoA hydrolase precursor, medium chain-like n=1 Tax=Prorops nasuta TaxID=863751 RepID=UPI0034CE8DC7